MEVTVKIKNINYVDDYGYNDSMTIESSDTTTMLGEATILIRLGTESIRVKASDVIKAINACS